MSDEDFKYLIEKFGSKNLDLLKQKGAYPYEFMHSFERFNEENLPARKCFLNSTKKWKIDSDGKKSDGYISFKDIWRAKKSGMSLAWKICVIITIIILKKMYCF